LRRKKDHEQAVDDKTEPGRSDYQDRHDGRFLIADGKIKKCEEDQAADEEKGCRFAEYPSQGGNPGQAIDPAQIHGQKGKEEERKEEVIEMQP